MIVLLDHALPVPRPRPADHRGDAVVLRERGELRDQVAGAVVQDRPHPVEPPGLREPAQQGEQGRHRGEQVRGVHRRGDHAPPDTRVRERPDQDIRGLASEPPMRGRVGHLDPVELGLLPGRVLDDRVCAFGDVRARGARRTQPAGTNLPRQRRIRPLVTERSQLVEQRHRPQVRVLGQSRGGVVDERVERVRDGALTHPGLAFTVQIRADGLAVMVRAAGDLADRHPLPFQSVDVHAAPL